MFESRLGRSINVNKRVRVYRNLHRSGPNGEPIYSVLQDGLVVGYVDSINLDSVKFLVNPSGRDYVRRTGKKTVHAFVEGYPTPWYLSKNWYAAATTHNARYNPRVNDTFIDKSSGYPLKSARLATVGPDGVKYAV